MDSITYETLIKNSKNVVDARLKFRDRRRENIPFWNEIPHEYVHTYYEYDNITYNIEDLCE